MPLDIAVLDCSNYPQLVVVEETNLDDDKKRWEKDEPDSAKVFSHIGVREGEPDAYVGEVLEALCKNRQFERGLQGIFERVFRSGRQFEREYPEGRGSNGDMRVYRKGDEIQFYVSLQPKRLYRKNRDGLKCWTGAAWRAVTEMHEHAGPTREHIAKFYMKEISAAVQRPFSSDSQVDLELFRA